jgi:hypothetical protein
VSAIVSIGLPALLLLAILGIVVRFTAGPLTNPDTFFHLRFGHEFLDGWSLRDPGSVTSQATAHWVPTQWLPEEVMAKFEDWFGLAGVAWLSGFQILVLVAALWVAARRRTEPLLVGFVLMAGLLGASVGLSARPQVISYIFVVITVDAWMRTTEDLRPRWWLIPLTWFWVMCHGMWPVGIALGGVVLVGMALDRRATARQWLRLACVPLLSAAAAAATPIGLEAYAQQLRVQDRAAYFTEWHSPQFTNHACVAVSLLLAVALVAMVRTGWPDWVTVLLLLVAGACAMWNWRTVPVAAVLLVPLASGALQKAMGRSWTRFGRRELVAVATGLALALAVLAALVPHRVPDPTDSPGWLQPAMESLPDDTEVLSDWANSAELMWRFPTLDVISHGYGDTYTLTELRRAVNVQSVGPGWVEDLKATKCTVALLPPGDGLTYGLAHQEHWRVVHRSSDPEMLVAPAGWGS